MEVNSWGKWRLLRSDKCQRAFYPTLIIHLVKRKQLSRTLVHVSPKEGYLTPRLDRVIRMIPIVAMRLSECVAQGLIPDTT